MHNNPKVASSPAKSMRMLPITAEKLKLKLMCKSNCVHKYILYISKSEIER